MPYQIQIKDTYWLLRDGAAGNYLMRAKTQDDLVYKIIKRLLYDIAWNSEQHNLYVNALRQLSIAPHKNAIASGAYTAAIKNHTSLVNFFKKKEQEKKDSIVYDSDYSDNSDDEPAVSLKPPLKKKQISAQMSGRASSFGPFQGAHAAQHNPIIKALRNNFVIQLKLLNIGEKCDDKLISNESGDFRRAIEETYRRHLKDALNQKSCPSVVDIKREDKGQYKITGKNQFGKKETLSTEYIPRVLLVRGVGYFSDRWHTLARRAHRADKQTSLYAEAILIRHFPPSPGQSYHLKKSLSEDDQEVLKNKLEAEASLLAKNLITLRNSKPIIVKQGSQYRIFSNWLEYLQHLYTNGIERFQKLIQMLEARVPLLNGLLPSKGNPFVSMSELAPHANRYGSGVKEPYNEFSLPPRYDKTGRPEKPYPGDLYITSHPWTDFIRHNKPHILREMRKLGSATTGSNIGPELEVSFLGKIGANRLKHQHRIHMPSFAKPICPVHYWGKYGIDEELYGWVSALLTNHKIHTHEYNRTIEYLREYLALYTCVRLTLWQLDEASKNKEMIFFLNESGGFTTKIPAWNQQTSRKNSALESEELKKLVSDNGLKHCFYAKGKEIYQNKQLKIFEVDENLLSKDLKSCVSERRATEFGSQHPNNSFELVDISNHSFSFKRSQPASHFPANKGAYDMGSLFDGLPDGFDIVSPKLVQLANGQPAWDVNVTGDGNCLLYSLVISYLLPKIENLEEFIKRISMLFGAQPIDQIEHIRKALQNYDGFAEQMNGPEKVLSPLINKENGLRDRLAMLILISDNIPWLSQLALYFDMELQTVVDVVNYIRTPGNEGDTGEMILFAALTNTVVHQYHQNGAFPAQAVYGNATVESINPDMPVDQILSVQHMAGHYHCLIPRAVLLTKLDDRFAQVKQASISEIEGLYEDLGPDTDSLGSNHSTLSL